jgi:hypothetical protein
MTRAFRTLAPALLLLAGALAALGDEPVRLFGKVKKAEADAFVLDDKGGPYNVALADDAEVLLCKAAILADLKPGTQLHVLGKQQPSARDPKSGATLPAAIVQIAAIVAAEKFEPPPVPKDLAERGCAWIDGPFQSKGKVVACGEQHIQVGHDRVVLVIAAGKKADVIAGKPAMVEGTRAEPKSKDVQAKRVAIVDPNAPPADRKIALGL